MAKTVADIQKDFRLFMDDTSDLSSSEEISLMDKIYQLVSQEMDWEKLKKPYSGTTSGTTLALPTGFSGLSENADYSENGEYGNAPVIYVGDDYTPYKVVSFSDRRMYRDQGNIAYIDIANDNLVFATDPGVKAVEYDYMEEPTALSDTDDTFWFPDKFAHILYHGMCADSFVIQQSEKARSYRDEHLSSYNMFLNNMKSWNFKLVQMN